MLTRDRLTAWRLAENLRQKDIAKKMRISASKWCGIESGTRTPNLDEAFRIESLTGIAASDWIDEPVELPPRARRRRVKKAA